MDAAAGPIPHKANMATSRMSRGVDLIHIGYHRCGSTTIQTDILGSHRGVAVTKDSRLAMGKVQDFAQCRFIGTPPNSPTAETVAISSEGLCGVNYVANVESPLWAEIPQQVHDTWPDAKILVMIRRQPDLIRSYYSLAVRKLSFTVPARQYYREVFHREYLYFDDLIGRYIDLYGTHAIKVLPVEMLFLTPGPFLSELSEFMGVDLTAQTVRRLNKGGSDSANKILRWMNLGLRALGKERGLATQKLVLRSALGRVLPAHQSFYAPGDREAIREQYRASNIRTSERIDIDLIGEYDY